MQDNVTQFRPIPALTEGDVARFHSGYQVAPNGCWIWLGPLSGNPTHKYGDFALSGRSFRAHRIAYVVQHGSIPDGMVIDHLCREPACVNPDHLEAVSPVENTLRGLSYPTHCKRGHRLEGDNVRMVGRQRKCRLCGRIRTQKWREKKNAA